MKAPKFTGGNRITLLKNGEAFFPALIEAIEQATSDIRIETYIFEDDKAGQRIAAALAAAARRGVAVRLMVDSFGSRETPDAFFAAMQDAGVKVLQFGPARGHIDLRKARLMRNHRKIALVDGKVGFVGGINLIDDHHYSLSEFPRYDYAVRVEGPLLAEIYPVVHRLWWWVAWQTLRHKNVGDPPPHPARRHAGEMRAAFVYRDNLRHRRDIEHAYRQAVGHARHEVLIVSAYFLPGRSLRRVLLAAAKRGVRVRLLVQGRADHPLLQLATRSLYGLLLGAGVEIHEYHRAMLHGKVAVIDGHWATVGSSNLDPFSLFLNREANVIVEDTDFAKQLRESVEQEMNVAATQCSVTDWQKRSWWARVQSWCAYEFARLVAVWMGFSGEMNN